MTAEAGEIRHTRTGAEFLITSVAAEVAGVDPEQWWQGCPECPLPVQGGPAAVAAHRSRVHDGDLRRSSF